MDINTARARVANDVLGVNIPVFSVDAAMEQVQADWAVVTTADTPPPMFAKRLGHKVNVVVDKPLATSVWECERIIASARRNNCRVIVGHNLRYNEYMLAMAKLVRGLAPSAGCYTSRRRKSSTWIMADRILTAGTRNSPSRPA